MSHHHTAFCQFGVRRKQLLLLLLCLQIGICGRPGSGKSSLILSLFGMVEITEGEIYIDGAIINNMPARLLRSRIAVLPQDCTLLSGTVRYCTSHNMFYSRPCGERWVGL